MIAYTCVAVSFTPSSNNIAGVILLGAAVVDLIMVITQLVAFWGVVKNHFLETRIYFWFEIVFTVFFLGVLSAQVAAYHCSTIFYILEIAQILSLMIGCMLFWNYSTNLQIKQKTKTLKELLSEQEGLTTSQQLQDEINQTHCQDPNQPTSPNILTSLVQNEQRQSNSFVNNIKEQRQSWMNNQQATHHPKFDVDMSTIPELSHLLGQDNEGSQVVPNTDIDPQQESEFLAKEWRRVSIALEQRSSFLQKEYQKHLEQANQLQDQQKQLQQYWQEKVQEHAIRESLSNAGGESQQSTSINEDETIRYTEEHTDTHTDTEMSTDRQSQI